MFEQLLAVIAIAESYSAGESIIDKFLQLSKTGLFFETISNFFSSNC